MRRVIVALAVASASAAAVVACTQLLGVDDIPTASPDAGRDATMPRDAGDGGRADAGDAGDGGGGGGAGDGGDAGDSAACTPGAMRCSADGLAQETCGVDGGWVVTACGGDTPVCLGGACSCVPGTARCEGQQPETCAALDGGPGWIDAGAACPGTCTKTGCGAPPPSCSITDAGGAGLTDCVSPNGSVESCCASYAVPGGTFYRSYDGFPALFNAPRDTTDAPATVSSFRLDRHEVSVGRFRNFFNALQSWRPTVGAGKHVHLNGGRGLVDVASGSGGFERGWVGGAWDLDLNALVTNAGSSLQCPGPSASVSWTNGPDNREAWPMECVTWYEAYAFCIWDGGFLPSEAEWNFAAAGGADQRIFPWSPPLASLTSQPEGGVACSSANLVGCTGVPLTVSSWRDAGDSRWLQADMSGNVLEWTLDVYSDPYTAGPCTDCAAFEPSSADAGVTRARRGGAYLSGPNASSASYRGFDLETNRLVTAGFRCARTP